MSHHNYLSWRHIALGIFMCKFCWKQWKNDWFSATITYKQYFMDFSILKPAAWNHILLSITSLIKNGIENYLKDSNFAQCILIMCFRAFIVNYKYFHFRLVISLSLPEKCKREKKPASLWPNKSKICHLHQPSKIAC